jgi:hypothetical protein
METGTALAMTARMSASANGINVLIMGRLSLTPSPYSTAARLWLRKYNARRPTCVGDPKIPLFCARPGHG